MTDFRTLMVTHQDVERLLPMPACIDLMAEALASTARGGALQPQAAVGGAQPAGQALPAALHQRVGPAVLQRAAQLGHPSGCHFFWRLLQHAQATGGIQRTKIYNRATCPLPCCGARPRC